MRSRNPRAADRSANHPIVFGAPYSGYVRAVRLALEEKDVRYELVPIDTFAPGGAPPEHQVRHPFGRIRAFEYAGFSLYEAGAITRFVDEVFPGPSLQPDDARARARVNQIISILDSYAYPTLVWDIYVERVSRPAGGASSDEQRISAAMPKAKVCLSALSEFMDGSPSLTCTPRRYSRFSGWLPKAPAFWLSMSGCCNGGVASARGKVFSHPGAAAPHLAWSRNRLVTRSSDLAATAGRRLTCQIIVQRLRGDAEAPWPADPAEIIDRYPREPRRLHRASDPAGETADDVDGPGNSILERDIEAASVQCCDAADPGYGRRAGDRDFLDDSIR